MRLVFPLVIVGLLFYLANRWIDAMLVAGQ